MIKRIKFGYLALLAALLISPAIAEVRLAHVFSDHMVIQCDLSVKLWGWADQDESVTVRFNGRQKKAVIGKDGQWQVMFPAVQAGSDTYECKVIGKKNEIVLTGILVGDVWICSGQSNMGMSVRGCLNAQEEIATANYPQIRLLSVGGDITAEPQQDILSDGWKLCSPETAGNFSAASYFFAREIYQKTGIPIGLIHSSAGGTNIETWTSTEAIRRFPFCEDKVKESLAPEFKKRLQESLDTNRDWNARIQADTEIPAWILSGDLLKNDLKMELPQRWEDKLMPGIDGVVWFQKEITLTDAQANSDIRVHLCLVDDNEQTFWNGTPIGATNGYNIERNYMLKKGIARPGKNILSIRVMDGGGSGGIRGDGKELYYEINDHKYTLCGEWYYKPWIVKDSRQQISANDYPSLLYHTKINPLTRLPIKGVLWYQGESNIGNAYQYRDLFPAMIRDWRAQWKQGDFPFLYAQLANCDPPSVQPCESATAELREAQQMALSLSQTGMAVCIDIGDANDVHAKNKQDVGYRLAQAGLKIAYGKDIVYSGPVYRSKEIKGDKVILTFDSVGSGLMAKDPYGYVKGFSIAAADRKFEWARAFIEDDQVVVYSPDVKNPVAVRYGWSENPDDVNLYNKEGLPASPFRTDTWKGVTEK
ncbi:9-O-acetylesterase [Bacteroidia bacterium]|nr:9-O-acetylesterase [Bacteroidia bacterium]